MWAEDSSESESELVLPNNEPQNEGSEEEQGSKCNDSVEGSNEGADWETAECDIGDLGHLLSSPCIFCHLVVSALCVKYQTTNDALSVLVSSQSLRGCAFSRTKDHTERQEIVAISVRFMAGRFNAFRELARKHLKVPVKTHYLEYSIHRVYTEPEPYLGRLMEPDYNLMPKRLFGNGWQWRHRRPMRLTNLSQAPHPQVE